MTSMRRLSYIMKLALAALALLAAGCGSGGGGSNGVINLNPPPAATGTLTIANPNLQINAPPTTVTAVLADAHGSPLSGITVTFTTTLGMLSPGSGTAVTDATGTATIQLLAGNTAGGGVVTASATVKGTNIIKAATFSVAMPQVFISAPVLGLSSLSPGGSTSVSVKLTTDAAGLIPFTLPVDVVFTSNFTAAGKASMLSPIHTVTGTAQTTYTAAGGVGVDTITVSVGGTSVTATVSVAGPVANSIAFISATPKNIALKGMGGLGNSETSTVVFKVLDVNGNPKSGEQVDFALNTTVGGLSLISGSASSASDGTVTAIVQSGIVATPVRVTATIHGSSPPISTQSDLLVISTGIPSQSYMSLAVATHNPEAFSIDGVTDVFTVFLADHFGNPVPDGTAVYFTAQAGQITPSCTTVNGVCSATWTSSGERTPDGRAAILAYAIGEESFIDINGNGVADAGTCHTIDTQIGNGLQQPAQCGEFVDMPQAWRDDAHMYTDYGYLKDGSVPVLGYFAHPGVTTSFPGFVGDPFINYNGSSPPVVDRDGMFNGILHPASDTAPTTKHVFQNNVIVMSTCDANISDLSSNTITPAPSTSIPASTALGFTIQDINPLSDNPLPAGTAVTVAGDGACLTTAASFTIPNTVAAPQGYAFGVKNTCVHPGSGTVSVSAGCTTRVYSLTW